MSYMEFETVSDIFRRTTFCRANIAPVDQLCVSGCVSCEEKMSDKNVEHGMCTESHNFSVCDREVPCTLGVYN